MKNNSMGLIVFQYITIKEKQDLSKLISTILDIMTNRNCFPNGVKSPANKVKSYVRNIWSSAPVKYWSQEKMKDAFLNMENLAKQMLSNALFLKGLIKDFKSTTEYASFLL